MCLKLDEKETETFKEVSTVKDIMLNDVPRLQR